MAKAIPCPGARLGPFSLPRVWQHAPRGGRCDGDTRSEKRGGLATEPTTRPDASQDTGAPQTTPAIDQQMAAAEIEECPYSVVPRRANGGWGARGAPFTAGEFEKR